VVASLSLNPARTTPKRPALPRPNAVEVLDAESRRDKVVRSGLAVKVGYVGRQENRPSNSCRNALEIASTPTGRAFGPFWSGIHRGRFWGMSPSCFDQVRELPRRCSPGGPTAALCRASTRPALRKSTVERSSAKKARHLCAAACRRIGSTARQSIAVSKADADPASRVWDAGVVNPSTYRAGPCRRGRAPRGGSGDVVLCPCSRNATLWAFALAPGPPTLRADCG